MARLGLLIDVTKCSGCHNCFLACRDEYYDNDYSPYSGPQPLDGQFWMQIKEVEGGKYPRPRLNYIAVPCQHCQNAPCVDAARDGADAAFLLDPTPVAEISAVAASSIRLKMGTQPLPASQEPRYWMQTLMLPRSPASVIGCSGLKLSKSAAAAGTSFRFLSI